jgi:hypothetical protein
VVIATHFVSSDVVRTYFAAGTVSILQRAQYLFCRRHIRNALPHVGVGLYVS